jgi:hypothetical protein
MAFDENDDAIFSNVIAGLPSVAELIATVPEDKRPRALEAAEQSYFKAARELGYNVAEAHNWVAAVMSHLREQSDEER